MCLLCLVDNGEVGFQIERLTMVGRYFRRAIDDGCAKFEHRRVFEDLEDDLVTDTVGISLRDSHANFPFLFHNSSVVVIS